MAKLTSNQIQVLRILKLRQQYLAATAKAVSNEEQLKKQYYGDILALTPPANLSDEAVKKAFLKPVKAAFHRISQLVHTDVYDNDQGQAATEDDTKEAKEAREEFNLELQQFAENFDARKAFEEAIKCVTEAKDYFNKYDEVDLNVGPIEYYHNGAYEKEQYDNEIKRFLSIFDSRKNSSAADFFTGEPVSYWGNTFKDAQDFVNQMGPTVYEAVYDTGGYNEIGETAKMLLLYLLACKKGSLKPFLVLQTQATGHLKKYNALLLTKEQTITLKEGNSELERWQHSFLVKKIIQPEHNALYLDFRQRVSSKSKKSENKLVSADLVTAQKKLSYLHRILIRDEARFIKNIHTRWVAPLIKKAYGDKPTPEQLNRFYYGFVGHDENHAILETGNGIIKKYILQHVEEYCKDPSVDWTLPENKKAMDASMDALLDKLNGTTQLQSNVNATSNSTSTVIPAASTPTSTVIPVASTQTSTVIPVASTPTAAASAIPASGAASASTSPNELEQIIKVVEDELESLIVEKIGRLDEEIWDALERGNAVRPLAHGTPIEQRKIREALNSSSDPTKNLDPKNPITKIDGVDTVESVTASTKATIFKARGTKAELVGLLRNMAEIKQRHRTQWKTDSAHHNDATTGCSSRATAIANFTTEIMALKEDFPLRDKPVAVAKAFVNIFAAAVAIVGTLVGGVASAFIGGGAALVDSVASTQYATRYSNFCKKQFNNVWNPIVNAITFTTDSEARISKGKGAVQEESQKIVLPLKPR